LFEISLVPSCLLLQQTRNLWPINEERSRERDLLEHLKWLSNGKAEMGSWSCRQNDFPINVASTPISTTLTIIEFETL
jgi:hypothetical protein